MPTKTTHTAAKSSGIALDEYRGAINVALEHFFDAVPAKLRVELSGPSLDGLAKLREYTLRPGKRIRSSLAAAAYDDVRHRHLAPAGIALGVAHEVMQSYILIVDDVMDKSDFRRNKPTVHREYLAEQDDSGSEHEANMLAINVGLIGQHVADLALIGADERAENTMRAFEALHRNFIITGSGQIDDTYQKIGRTVTQADIIRMYCSKSSYYTFVNPLQTGLLLAGVQSDEINGAVEKFGRAAGIAFQLHDDYLGVFGETETTGKPNTDDIKEGKYTLLVQYALERGTPSDVATLKQILGRPDVNQADLTKVQQIFNASGATIQTQTETRRYADEAKSHLASITVLSDPFKAFLAELLDYVISRKS